MAKLLSDRVGGAIAAWVRGTLAACTSAPVTHAAATAERPSLAITDGSVVDVVQGRTIGPRTVVVADGRIVAIEAPSGAQVPAGAERVDERGRFVIPGLTDMHVHLFNNSSGRPPNTWAFPLYVASSVAGVREMSARAESIAMVNAWREAWGEGRSGRAADRRRGRDGAGDLAGRRGAAGEHRAQGARLLASWGADR